MPQRSLFSSTSEQVPRRCHWGFLKCGHSLALSSPGLRSTQECLGHWEEGHAQRRRRDARGRAKEKRVMCQFRIWSNGLFCLRYQGHLSPIPRPWLSPLFTESSGSCVFPWKPVQVSRLSPNARACYFYVALPLTVAMEGR